VSEENMYEDLTKQDLNRVLSLEMYVNLNLTLCSVTILVLKGTTTQNIKGIIKSKVSISPPLIVTPAFSHLKRSLCC